MSLMCQPYEVRVHYLPSYCSIAGTKQDPQRSSYLKAHIILNHLHLCQCIGQQHRTYRYCLHQGHRSFPPYHILHRSNPRHDLNKQAHQQGSFRKDRTNLHKHRNDFQEFLFHRYCRHKDHSCWLYSMYCCRSPEYILLKHHLD